MPRTKGVYRDGLIHVCKIQCSTCIFRRGNLMSLARGRVKQMVRDATRSESCIPCHQTLDGPKSVCRGFFDKHKTSPLQIAERLGLVEFTELSAEP